MDRDRAFIEALRMHGDGLKMASDRDWINGRVLKTFNALMRKDDEEIKWKQATIDLAREVLRLSPEEFTDDEVYSYTIRLVEKSEDEQDRITKDMNKKEMFVSVLYARDSITESQFKEIMKWLDR